MRKIAVVTGSRSEYGLLKPVMTAIKNSDMKLLVVSAGMHLKPEYGSTYEDIGKDGFKIDAEVFMPTGDTLAGSTVGGMAESIGHGILGMNWALDYLRPDIILCLGDRVEPLAATIAGAYMNIPVAHIHGGEVSGNIDDSTRHAITKFAHLHFPATKESAERIIKLGEETWRIHVVGTLGINATHQGIIPKAKLFKELGLDLTCKVILVVQHPETSGDNAEKMGEIMDAVTSFDYQIVVIYPNSDSGSEEIINIITGCPVYAFQSLPYIQYVSLLKHATVLVGNSSSGIYEAPLFGTPVVNVGNRQDGRERVGNITDVPFDKHSIIMAIKDMGKVKTSHPFKIHTEGVDTIIKVLREVEINQKLFQKRITY